MPAANSIINVTVSRSTPTVSQQAFSAALILSGFTYWPDDSRTYSSTAAMLADGFLDSDPAYLAAQDHLGPSPKPALFIVGRRAMTLILTFAVQDSFEYSATIGGIAYTYTSGAEDNAAAISAGLIAAINAGTGVHGLTASAGTTYQIVLSPAAMAGSCPAITALSLHLTLANGALADTIANDLNRIQNSNSNWYGICLADRNDADASAIAAWTEASPVPHDFIYASANLLIINSTEETSSLPYLWKAAGYTKSACFYHSLAATRYPDAETLGAILPQNPGSYTVKFTSLPGMPADTLTTSQIATAAGILTGNVFTPGKNALLYINTAGNNMVIEGMASSGDYIDTMIFIDWLVSALATNVFALFVASKKVPFTDAGLQAVGSIVKGILNACTDPNGANPGLTQDTKPIVTVPTAASYTALQKESRIASGITFSAELSGAIHFVTIAGNVTP